MVLFLDVCISSCISCSTYNGTDNEAFSKQDCIKRIIMKPLLGYLFLANGIIFGIASNSFAKISEGFTKLTPSVLCILFMCITMFSIAKAMSALPVGFAYSTYSGLTVTGVVLFAVLKFNQVPNIYATIGIILIIIGVIMVNYLGRLN